MGFDFNWIEANKCHSLQERVKVLEAENENASFSRDVRGSRAHVRGSPVHVRVSGIRLGVSLATDNAMMELGLLRGAIILLCELFVLNVIAFIVIGGKLEKILDLLKREWRTK